MAIIDVTMKKNGRTYHDLDIVDGDLKATGGFESALNMSIMCERRASASEVPSPEKRRGWWGNEALDVDNFEIGSKLWLLSQARANNITLNKTVTSAKQALSWFIDDQYLDKIQASADYDNEKTMNLNISLIRSQDIVFSKSFKLWQNTILEIDT